MMSERSIRPSAKRWELITETAHICTTQMWAVFLSVVSAENFLEGDGDRSADCTERVVEHIVNFRLSQRIEKLGILDHKTEQTQQDT